MGVIAKGIPRGCQGLVTPVSLGYPLSVSNNFEKLYSQSNTHTHMSFQLLNKHSWIEKNFQQKTLLTCNCESGGWSGFLGWIWEMWLQGLWNQKETTPDFVKSEVEAYTNTEIGEDLFIKWCPTNPKKLFGKYPWFWIVHFIPGIKIAHGYKINSIRVRIKYCYGFPSSISMGFPRVFIS